VIDFFAVENYLIQQRAIARMGNLSSILFSIALYTHNEQHDASCAGGIVF
jgi:hypothetical protein